MKESGKMIYSMDKVKKYGLIILDMKVLTMRVKNMELVFTFGKMDHLTMEIGLKIGLRDMVSTNGKTVGLTQVNGKTTICTVKEFTLGLMEDAMKVSMRWIKNTAMVSIHGQMEEFTRDLG